MIKEVRERTLSVGKSRARKPTQNHTQNPTPNRPEPGRTIQRLRTAPCPCPQALRSARGAWRAHGPISEETAHTPCNTRSRQGPQARSGTESYAWKNQKEKNNSTLNHSHAVVAPHRDSSTHHTPLHHSKVHPPLSFSFSVRIKSSLFLVSDIIYNLI
jgi:hypothetical protein